LKCLEVSKKKKLYLVFIFHFFYAWSVSPECYGVNVDMYLRINK